MQKNKFKYTALVTLLVCIQGNVSASSRWELLRDTVSDTLMIHQIKKNYIHFPVKIGNPKTWIQIRIKDSVVQEIEVPLATSAVVDYHSRFEVGPYKGEKLQLVVEKTPVGSRWKDKLMYSDKLFVDKGMYKETLRPQIHFSPQRGWLNDPNGLFYFKGKYHMFFQHVPFSTTWDNTTMSWGHATSTDLIHWNEHKVAIQPDRLGVAFSGSAVVDWYNTSGFQDKPILDSEGKLENPALVILYTTVSGRYNATYGQSIAYSLDEGVSWQKYTGNPVLPYQKQGGDRDPKVFWYGDKNNGKWIMPLYIMDNSFSIFSSKDLKNWEKMSDIADLGCNECPDLIQLDVDNRPGIKKWVFWGGAGCYMVGDFDGIQFTPETSSLTVNYGGADYAGQTFSNIPEEDGRIIQISWLRGGYPDMPFSQAMNIPRELRLKETSEGHRLTSYPVHEVNELRKNVVYQYDKAKKIKAIPSKIVLEKGQAVDIDLQLILQKHPVADGENSHIFEIEILGQRLSYDLESSVLKIGTLQAQIPKQQILDLRIIVDRTSVEVFANGGEVALSHSFISDLSKDQVIKISDFGKSHIQQMKVYGMRSIW